MVLRLAEQLEIPLRERNAVLVAAGYAPLYGERALDDPGLEPARKAIELILNGHEPHPALAVNRHWVLVSANGPAARLMSGIAEALLTPPVNVLRLSLHPQGLGPRIENFREWRAHVLARLDREAQNSADPVILALIDELRSYPVPAGARPYQPSGHNLANIAVPLALITEMGTLRLLSTTTVFGTALDITLSELAVEAFFPADEETAAIIRRMEQVEPVHGSGQRRS